MTNTQKPVWFVKQNFIRYKAFDYFSGREKQCVTTELTGLARQRERKCHEKRERERERERERADQIQTLNYLSRFLL